MTSDGLQHFKYVDIPMGESWIHSINQGKPNDIMDAVSGGHIYGKRVMGAEVFTSKGISSRLLKTATHPATGKDLRSFHRWSAQTAGYQRTVGREISAGLPCAGANHTGRATIPQRAWRPECEAFFRHGQLCNQLRTITTIQGGNAGSRWLV